MREIPVVRAMDGTVLGHLVVEGLDGPLRAGANVGMVEVALTRGACRLYDPPELQDAVIRLLLAYDVFPDGGRGRIVIPIREEVVGHVMEKLVRARCFRPAVSE